jgi:glycosyltransferase involved in cell wall biosynthesis/uncharacterized coiled-coil protein SlyX
MRMTFNEALEYFNDGSIDLLHIDGYHTYEAIKLDVESWLPKMSDRGVILLHDTQVRRDEFGAWKLWEAISNSYPSYEFKFGYGLGVLAVGKNVPDIIIQFIDEARGKIFIERLFFTLGADMEFRTRIQSLEGEVAEVRNTIAQKEERVGELEVSLEDRNQHIQSLEGEVAEVRNTIAKKDDRIRELEVSLEDRNQHIQSLEGEVAEVRNTIAEKDDRIRELEASLEDRNQHIQSLEGEVAEVRNTIAQKDDRVREIEMENLRIGSELNSMKTSVTWRTVMKWHLFVEKVMPQETNRRSRYDLGIIGLRTIANEGWRSFWWKYKQHIRQTKPLPKRKIKIDSISLPKGEYKKLNEIIDAKVSVVIPTKNAGNDFEYVLDKLINQEGLKEIEIVAVDSGSTDDTIEIAKKYGVEIYQIKPEDFGHGKTRNLGAEKATGEFLLLTTQDAIPASKYLVYKMVNILKGNPKVAAVTCRQIPRSDADLMACFQVWSHYQKFLDIREDKLTSVKNMATITPLQKRKMANLSDSCCCIRRDLFSQYRFKTEFAEDLDLGIRFLDDGYKLAYLHSVAIIHSHNRIPSYFFKVSYTDSKVVSRIVGNAPLRWNTKDISVFYACIKKLYENIIVAISLIEKESKNEINDILTMLKELLNLDLAEKKIEDYTGDPTLDKLFNEIESIIDYYEKEQVEKTVYNILLSAYLETLSTFSEYAMSYPSVFSIKKDFISTQYKLFANSLGASLGNFILFLYEKNITTQEIENLDKYLSGGV